MKFGLIYELSTPRPFTRETQKAVYENAIEQTVLADALGYSTVWCVEYHFLEEYSHASCPEMFLAAFARDSIPPFRLCYCHWRVREASPYSLSGEGGLSRQAVGGRVEFGTGRSSTWNELGSFNAPLEDPKRS